MNLFTVNLSRISLNFTRSSLTYFQLQVTAFRYCRKNTHCYYQDQIRLPEQDKLMVTKFITQSMYEERIACWPVVSKAFIFPVFFSNQILDRLYNAQGINIFGRLSA